MKNFLAPNSAPRKKPDECSLYINKDQQAKGWLFSNKVVISVDRYFNLSQKCLPLTC